MTYNPDNSLYVLLGSFGIWGIIFAAIDINSGLVLMSIPAALFTMFLYDMIFQEI